MRNYWIGTLIFLLTPFSTPVLAQLRDRPDFFEQGYEQFEQEIQRIQQVQPSSDPSNLTINDGSQQWSRVILREGKCSVWMPLDTVSQEIKTVETAAGEVKFRIIATHPLSSRFVIAYSEELDATLRENPLELLEQAQERIISQEGQANIFELTIDENLTLDGYIGKDFTLKNESETINFRLFLVDERMYLLAVSQLNESESTDAVTKFFASFQLL